MTESLLGKRIVLIGGSSGIGLAVAQRAVAEGADIVIGARNADKRARAVKHLGSKAVAYHADTSDQASLAAFFDEAGQTDHLFISAAIYSIAGIDSDDQQAVESPFRSKFWGQYHAVKQALPYLTRDGSVTLMSGAAGARPLKGAAAYAACNSAIEGLGRALANDLAPVRVNTVSPGTIDGHLWQNRPAAIRDAAFEHYGRIALAGRPGTEAEVADAVLFLMKNRFMTGSVLYVDGGYILR